MFTVREIVQATGGRVIGDADLEVSGVSTDSRTIRPGELFVPLVGERFDGHAYLADVIAKGASVLLAEEERFAQHQLECQAATTVVVADTLKALGNLASAWRSRFDVQMIGITGSNGKTTTKEMLAAILEQTGAGLKTAGNLNNLIGLPQMLFRLTAEHGWGVLEMGMSETGEIDRLAEIASPRIGVVLNAFPAHLASMASVENVARAKGELLQRLQDGGCAVVNADDPLIAAQPSPAGVRRLTFGLGEANIRATAIEQLGTLGQRFTLHLPDADFSVTLHAFGRHNIYNALAAAGAAHAAGIAPELIRSGLEKFRPYDKRFRLEEVRGVRLIDDSYNANPASMAAALTTLAELKGNGHAFVALGDMLELGGDETGMHRQLGIQAATVADRLYLCGELTAHTASSAVEAGLPADAVICTASHDEIVDDILSRVVAGDFVLVKGSRGMRMEKIAEGIRSRMQG